MPIVLGWMNVYKSGFWHKAGKPTAYDRHAGDIYPTEVAAFDAIEQPQLYVATVPVHWEEPTVPHINPPSVQA